MSQLANVSPASMACALGSSSLMSASPFAMTSAKCFLSSSVAPDLASASHFSADSFALSFGIRTWLPMQSRNACLSWRIEGASASANAAHVARDFSAVGKSLAILTAYAANQTATAMT